MARAPAAASSADDATDAAGADTGTDAGDDSGETVVVTITKLEDGTYKVYPGDEPDEGDETGEGQSADDLAALGASGGSGGASGGSGGATGASGEMGGAEQGVTADSIGQALKAAMDILNEDASSEGEEGSSQDQFESGFGEDKGATPTGRPAMRQKY